MNERTQLFIKIYLSLFILERVDVWEMDGDRDRLLYWPKFFSWPQQHLFRIVAGVAQQGIAEDLIP